MLIWSKLQITSLKQAALAWLGLFVLAFVNGALREIILKNYFAITEPLAHQLSCLSGVVLWTSFTMLIWSKLQITSLKQSAWIGLGWFTATLLFETFVLNAKLSWVEIFHTYDVLSGEFWGLVLLWIGILPIAMFWLKNRTTYRLGL
jgi:hypothetical protein